MSSEHVNAETISTMQSIGIPPRCYSYSGRYYLTENRRRFFEPDFLSLSLRFPLLQSSVVIPIEIIVELLDCCCSFSSFLLMTLFTTHFGGINSGSSEFFSHRNRNVSLIE